MLDNFKLMVKNKTKIEALGMSADLIFEAINKINWIRESQGLDSLELDYPLCQVLASYIDELAKYRQLGLLESLPVKSQKKGGLPGWIKRH